MAIDQTEAILLRSSTRKHLEQQEEYLLSMRERLDKRSQKLSESSTFVFERAKFIGMISVAQNVLKMDVSSYQWIYNAI